MRIDIERALDELVVQEEGMRFQGLAVVIGKNRWPDLIARQRKKDYGLDAYAPPNLTSDKTGRGLAASITPTLSKISRDAKTAKNEFPDLRSLLFVTSGKVGNAVRKKWEKTILIDHGLELHLIEREEIISLLMMPENASLCASFLNLDIDVEPQISDLINRAKRASGVITEGWASKTKGHPLIDLTSVRLNSDGGESNNVLSLEQIGNTLSKGARIVLEGPAGRGKTTTLIQLAQRSYSAGTPFIVELPAWTTSGRGILEFIAGLPAFQAEGLTVANLARIQQVEPFLLLLNGWNEIAESNSMRANEALRELERDFPSAGIIVATRTHHLTPPLPGATRLRVLRLRRMQRTEYLIARLGSESSELCARIEGDRSLEELTRTPFILSEVASLFEAGVEIPSTKFGILAQVIRLQEQREEHRNILQSAPLYGRHEDFLKALAIQMTLRGAVAITEAEARVVVATVLKELVDLGQVDTTAAPVILATITAHHILERVAYPEVVFQFQHQQFQEYYAALDVRVRILNLKEGDQKVTDQFIADYVNEPAWSESLCMIAETLSENSTDSRNTQNSQAGGRLIEMALAVDPVFAGELAGLSSEGVWSMVRQVVGERFRSIYEIPDRKTQQLALAAMIASGKEDFRDILVPLFSGDDQQSRISTYRLWPDVRVSLLGAGWRDQVRAWSEPARADFICEMLRNRVDDEVAAFALEDESGPIKKVAVLGLMWLGAGDAAVQILESMDAETFEDVVQHNALYVPIAVRPKAIVALLALINKEGDHTSRLRILKELVDLQVPNLGELIKDTLASLSGEDVRNMGPYYVRPALEYLRQIDPIWVSEWVVVRIGEGILYEPAKWLSFVVSIAQNPVEEYMARIVKEDLRKFRFDGMIAVIVAHSNIDISARIFYRIRELRCKLGDAWQESSELERNIVRQLEALFQRLPANIAVAGILSSVRADDYSDIKIAVKLISRVAKTDLESLQLSDRDLKLRLRSYLKSSVGLVILQENFSGDVKADLISSIVQVGEPEDIRDLARLIHADIDRIRMGRISHANGEPKGRGSDLSFSRWNLTSIASLGPAVLDPILIEVIPEPEYSIEAAECMAREFMLKPNIPFGQKIEYELVWAARKGGLQPVVDERRQRFAVAIIDQIKALQNQVQGNMRDFALKELVKSLAAVDGRNNTGIILELLAWCGKWVYTCIEIVENLLLAGVIVPTKSVFPLIDSILERTGAWMQEEDRSSLRRLLAICPFVDDPILGIAKMREVLKNRKFHGHELRELIIALGESRSDSAGELLYELAMDTGTFEQCEDVFIVAFSKLDTLYTRELLFGFLDPSIPGIALTPRFHGEVLIARIADLAFRQVGVAARLQELCGRHLPELNRHILSKIMEKIGSSEALYANLNLIDDASMNPVPQGLWEQLHNAFVERRPFDQDANSFTEHARASNELRALLFKMSNRDTKRKKSALMILGKIEEWRLNHGRPAGEPRHPSLSSGEFWPPINS